MGLLLIFDKAYLEQESCFVFFLFRQNNIKAAEH